MEKVSLVRLCGYDLWRCCCGCSLRRARRRGIGGREPPTQQPPIDRRRGGRLRELGGGEAAWERCGTVVCMRTLLTSAVSAEVETVAEPEHETLG